jgi:FAD-dependent monooxygenase
VHFKSRDLKKLHKFGTFWHHFIYSEKGLHAAAICQDDENTFTTHLLLPMDVDHESIDSHEAVYRCLGGMGGPFKIEIEEILVRSTYRHSIAVARTYRSRLGRVFLAGDSAHQNIPTGGYGMNMVRSHKLASIAQDQSKFEIGYRGRFRYRLETLCCTPRQSRSEPTELV